MTAETVTAPMSKHVLVIGIDGVRLDYLHSVPTPNLDGIAAKGFLAPVAVDPGAPSLSGPCWATVATGVSPVRHGIYGNDFTGHRLRTCPDFLTIVSKYVKRRSYLAVGSWPPLAVADSGGPLFAEPSRMSFARFDHHDCDSGDEMVTGDAERVLAEDDVAVSFVYLGAADEIAHEHGCGELYREAIERADARTGRLLAALESRPDRGNEEWTVIAVTDHGHVDAGGHGGDSDEERTAWIAAFGPDIAAGAELGTLRHVDVAAHVYRALGLTPVRELALEGRPFGG